jgi:hypothetical protein
LRHFDAGSNAPHIFPIHSTCNCDGNNGDGRMVSMYQLILIGGIIICLLLMFVPFQFWNKLIQIIRGFSNVPRQSDAVCIKKRETISLVLCAMAIIQFVLLTYSGFFESDIIKNILRQL